MDKIVVFPNQRSAKEGEKAFPGFRCIYPHMNQLQGWASAHIVVMSDVDMYQMVEGYPLYVLLQQRQMKFPENERLLIHLRSYR